MCTQNKIERVGIEILIFLKVMPSVRKDTLMILLSTAIASHKIWFGEMSFRNLIFLIFSSSTKMTPAWFSSLNRKQKCLFRNRLKNQLDKRALSLCTSKTFCRHTQIRRRVHLAAKTKDMLRMIDMVAGIWPYTQQGTKTLYFLTADTEFVTKVTRLAHVIYIVKIWVGYIF